MIGVTSYDRLKLRLIKFDSIWGELSMVIFNETNVNRYEYTN